MRFIRAVTAAVLLLSTVGYAEPAGRPMLNQPAGWCWFSDPRAVYSAGRTFVGFTAGTGIWVGAYDHTAHTWTTSEVATVTTADDHNVPSIGVRPDGRILVAWVDNGGPGPVLRRISTNPGDVSAWGPTDTAIAGQYSYTNLLRLDNGTWYLFSRRYDPGGRTNVYATSTDEGATWSASTDLVLSDNRPYAKFSASGDRIDMTISTGHPELVTDNSIYHAYFDGRWRASDGTDLGAPPFTVNDLTKVYDGSTVKGWTWDIAPGPVIAFATFPTITDHRYQYATWDGAWQVREVTPAGGSIDAPGIDPDDPHYSGGITLDHDNPGHVYLSRQVSAEVWAVEHWWTSDAGRTWSSQRLSTAAVKNIRPVVPRGGSPVEVFWLAGSYTGWDDWDTEIVSLPELDAGFFAFNVAGHGFGDGRFVGP